MTDRRSAAGWLAGVALGATLLAGCSSASGEVAGAVLTEPYTVPATSLTDTGGEPYSLADDTAKRLTLVFFGYTNCPDICQTVMANVTAGLTRLDDADRDQVDVVFVTTDPARDDEQVLRTYLDRFDPSFVGLTGDLDTITEIGADVGVAVEEGKKLPSGGYEVTHSTQVLGVDGNDRVPIVWTEGTSASEFASDIHTLLGDG
ncbi:SCO family protein [Nocardioides aestuarii]|uniref:SCO family protein n=1 Tax=Nocardioides aestuarii TaxID=252231 RepID=A0ABW4TGM9_9ACTN